MIKNFRTAADTAAEKTARKAERARISAQKVVTWYNDPENAPDAPKIAIQRNNSKIKDNERQAFLIFSLPALISCPFANSECERGCYARRDERFPSVRKYRLANFILARNADFVEMMKAAIREKIYTKAGKLRKPFIGKEIIFRLHESGDFFSPAYTLAWFEIARAFPEIQFFTYTKSFPIYAACKDHKPANFVVRASLWQGATTEEELNLVRALGMPVYTVLESTDGADFACDCAGGCGACGCACAVAALAEIVAAFH